MTISVEDTTTDDPTTVEPDPATTEPDADEAGDGYRTREQRYRMEKNAAIAERDALAEQVTRMQTRELERLAGESLSNPADLLTLSGMSLADFLDDDGELDPELVADAASDLLSTRPGLRPGVTRVTDASQGQGGRPVRKPASWADLKH